MPLDKFPRLALPEMLRDKLDDAIMQKTLYFVAKKLLPADEVLRLRSE
jgi:hypothetical protein